MKALSVFGFLAACFFVGSASGQAPARLPKVVLVGDSIRMSYEGVVAKKLQGKAVVVGPKANCGPSVNVVKNLDAWVIAEKPDIVHFNCGIHDTKKFTKDGSFQVSPEQYEANLRKIVERLRKETSAKIVFATSTPILTDRAAKTRAKADYTLSGESIERYNAIAKKVMAELDVPINDLHGVFADRATREKAIAADGVHFTAEAAAILGAAVAEFVAKTLPAADRSKIRTEHDAGGPPSKKVLLIGIDGCRTDALLAARAKHLQKLANDGAMSVNNDVLGDRKPQADSVTLPGWTSMLTGVWFDKHGVRDNGHRKPALFASFFSRLRAANPQATAVAFMSFRTVPELVFVGEDARMVLDGSKNGFDKADQFVAEAAVKHLTEKDPTVVMAYFGQVDSAGHRHGFHPKVEQYTTAIEAVDRHVGQILAAITHRPKYASEDWLILVATDHGGRGLSHTGAGSYDEVRRTFLIVSGPSSSKENMPEKTGNVDVAVTAMTHLGMNIRPEWNLDGRSVGLKR